ncbi:hypothetical protein AMTR_s00182p00045950, partial [Amborella trichopoda]
MALYCNSLLSVISNRKRILSLLLGVLRPQVRMLWVLHTLGLQERKEKRFRVGVRLEGVQRLEEG